MSSYESLQTVAPFYLPSDLETNVPESVEVQLTRIDGKLDALTEKLDARLDLVLEKMESGDRESVALFKLLEGEQNHIRANLNEHDKRIANVASEFEREHDTTNSKIEEVRKEAARRLDEQEKFKTQAKTVIALIILLMPVITAALIKAFGI